MSSIPFDEKRSSCPVCGSPLIGPLATIDSYEIPFTVDTCRECRFSFMNPSLGDSAIEELYGREYYSREGNYHYHDEREMEKYSSYVWDARVGNIRKFIKKGNFLDVGSSFGGLLKSASRYFTPFGIELSEYSASSSEKIPGLTIHRGTLEDHPFEAGSFSVITMVELIEHLKDPVSAIEECFNLLKTGGLLLVQTANMDGMQARILKERYAYFMPGHLSYFNRENLTHLLLKSGFKRVRAYIPVDFGLIPKLKKSRHDFNSLMDYTRWFRISWYHMISKLHFGNFAATSSMVLYAFK